MKTRPICNRSEASADTSVCYIFIGNIQCVVVFVLRYTFIFPFHYNLLRFDLLANGGASLTLRYERAPFPTLHRTVWLPWNVFHVMDTVVMKREENDIPSCYLTGLIRPNPLIVATPLSTLYKTSPEDSPIIPETQVRLLSQRRHGGFAFHGLCCKFPNLFSYLIVFTDLNNLTNVWSQHYKFDAQYTSTV